MSAPAVTDMARRQLRLLAGLLIAVNVCLPIGQIIYAEAIGENYAEFFWGEWNAIAWFSSVQLLIVGLIAYANHQAIGRLNSPGTRRWIWLMFAAGFVFLSLDERFGFHEYLRDDVFRPNQTFNLPFLRDGDVSMYGYLAVGLVLGYFLLAELRQRTSALVLFGVGVAVATASIIVDTLAKDITREWIFSKFWTSAFEETAETWAQMFFAFSFLVLLDWRLARLDGLVEAARNQVTRVAQAAVAVNLLLPLGMLVYAAYADRTFWLFFSAEDGPTEWLSSVQCLVVAAVAWAIYLVNELLRRGGEAASAVRSWGWLAIGAGFFVLGLDERFDLHEELRDVVLRPIGFMTNTPNIVPGDVGLYLFYTAGLGLVAWMRTEFRSFPPALAVLGAAFALGLPVIVIDSLTDAAIKTWPFRTFWDYPFEELGELWAELLCLIAFCIVLYGRLGELAGQLARRRDEA
ncbi:MAG: hypothetical protein VX246_15895 [Myxococcota bacterium]|nr:hypothetical protein [Myxococcota bacterium]